MTLKRYLRLSVFCSAIVMAIRSPDAWGCASCGSGSDDPLILWPSEQLKTYVGVSTSSRFESVDPRGQRGRESGPKSRDALTLAVGKSLRNDLFFTFTLPLLQNRLDSKSLRTWGDPMLAARWSWVVPDFTEPAIPQVQVMASYKFATARSLQESERTDLLDAFGTGIPESKFGVDVFWGQTLLKGGIALAGLFPDERTLGRTSVFPGNGLRATATSGVSLGGDSKFLLGLVRETREERRNNGLRAEDSKVVAHAIFSTVDWSPAQRQMIRLTLTDKGRVFENRNMIATTSFTLAWLSTWE
jgi:hypothetical protein